MIISACRTRRLSAIAVLAASVAIGGAAASAAPASAAAPAVDGPGDGIYHFALTDQNRVMTKQTTCDQGAGGTYVYAQRDSSRFSQKWRLIKQENGTYVIASMCQPTVLMTDVGGPDLVRFEYGTDGPTSALGSWNPYYDYRVAHAPNQEWYVTAGVPGVNPPGTHVIRSATSDAYFVYFLNATD